MVEHLFKEAGHVNMQFVEEKKSKDMYHFTMRVKMSNVNKQNINKWINRELAHVGLLHLMN